MAEDLIIEVGAHDGDNTAFFLAKGFPVVAIEPNPACAARLRHRFAEPIHDGKLVVAELAAHETAGLTLPFAVTQNPRWSRLVLPESEPPSGTVETIEVTTTNYRDMLARWGRPHLLQVHINTHEASFLKSLDGIGPKPENICAHISSARPIAVLYEVGYRAFKLVSDDLNIRQRPPNPPLEGSATVQGAGPGWSGYFGMELPGRRWSPIEDMPSAMEALSQLRRLETVIGGSFSIHARMEAPAS